mgnify:CR=1 FL=1
MDRQYRDSSSRFLRRLGQAAIGRLPGAGLQPACRGLPGPLSRGRGGVAEAGLSRSGPDWPACQWLPAFAMYRRLGAVLSDQLGRCCPLITIRFRVRHAVRLLLSGDKVVVDQ